MLGTTRRGRITGWMAAFGVVALVIALVSPGTSDAGAEAAGATERGARPMTAAREQATTSSAPLRREVDLWVIAVPANGGDLPVFDAPGAPAPSQVLPAVNELGSPLVVLAVEQQDQWYRVLLPSRPNGSSAWVPVGAVTATPARYEVVVSLSARVLRVVHIPDRVVVLTSPIGIGAPSSPTPTGLFYVRDHFPTTGGNHPYGPYAFGLSGHSEVHMQFGTGDGRIAIHGTNQPASIGAAVSNGCVHVPNDVVLAMIQYLPPGTPVTIEA